MAEDTLDTAVAKYVRTAGLATQEQVTAAMQEQARLSAQGTPVSLSDALLRLGFITDAQHSMVVQKAKAKGGVQQFLHYKLLKKLGEGGMGAVYLAEDTRKSSKVALKVLPKKYSDNVELLKRFRREADAAFQLKHPNIVGAYGVGEDLGYHFYVMEYCEGETLDATLKRDKHLPVARALELTLQAAQGLKHAHDHGFIHRDIKPANIIVTKDGTARLLDLGLSKNLEDTEKSFKTVSGAVLGTPHYIAPEQAQGEKNVDGRADIYSLGATFYHLMTGQTPFDGATILEILSKQVNAQLPNPQDLREEIPDGVVHVLRRMMAKDPADRYRNCAELLKDLEEAVAGKAPATKILDPNLSAVALVRKKSLTRRPATLRRSAPAAGSRTGVWIGAAVLLVAAVGIYAAMPGTPEPETVVRPPDRKAAPPPKEEPRPAAERTAVDLLPLIDLGKHVVTGDWKRTGVELRGSGGHARIEIPFDPPDEYDFQMSFTRIQGNDVGQVLTKSGKWFVWHMGGWSNYVLGFSVIGGQTAKDHPSSVTKTGVLSDGRKYTSRVEVRKDRISAYLDDVKQVEWKTDYSDLTGLTEFQLPNPRRLGFGTFGEAIFHSATLVDAAGKPAPPSDAAWIASMAGKTPAQQVEAVKSRLRELNPGFDGDLQHEAEKDAVTKLSLSSPALRDLSPLRALPSLKRLECPFSAATDFSFLSGMKQLHTFIAYRSGIRTLSPLKGLPLEYLHVSVTAVEDLEPIRGAPLESLHIDQTRVSDLSPIRGTNLKVLAIGKSPVTDLSPLGSLPLEELGFDVPGPAGLGVIRSIKTLKSINGLPAEEFWKTHPAAAAAEEWAASVAALAPDQQVEKVMTRLKELNPKLKMKEKHQNANGAVVELSFSSSGVTDLSPVAALTGLRKLDCTGTWDSAKGAFDRTLVDLSPLSKLKLKVLGCGGTLVADLTPLSGMPLEVLDLGGTDVSDLAPLKDLPLTELTCTGTPVTDLRPLQGLRLKMLACEWTQVRDLAPLKGMPLEILHLTRAPVTDLSPLFGSRLRELRIDAVTNKDASLLRSMKTLERINDKSVTEFLKARATEAPTAISLEKGLVGHWKLDEGKGGTVANAVAPRLLGSVIGPTWTRGPFGGALQFKKQNDYVSIPEFSLHGKAITLSAWVNHASLDAPIQRYLTLMPECAVLRYDRSQFKGLHFYLMIDGTHRHVTTAALLKPGAWHHVAGTWDGSTQRLYLDGGEVASENHPGTLGAGRNLKISSETNTFQGVLDDARIYDRALTAEEIRALSDARPPDPSRGLVGHWKLDEKSGDTAADASGQGNTARLDGAASWVPGQIGGGLRFTGNDAVLELPNSPVLDDLQDESFTIAAWFKPEALPAAADKRDPEYGLFLKPGFNVGLKYAPPGMMGMEHWLKGDVNVGIYSPGGDCPPGRFYHVAGTFDRTAGVTLLYVNGSPRGTRKWAAGTAVRAYGKATWRIGIMLPRAAVSRWATKGILDDARLYNRVLGADEIAVLAGAGGWRPIFDGKSLNFISDPARRSWALENGAVVTGRDPEDSFTARSEEEFGDGDYRFGFEVRNAKYVELSVRQGPGGSDQVSFNRAELERLEGKKHELVFSCRGAEVTATLDGQPVALKGRSRDRRGAIHFFSMGPGLRVHSIEFRKAP